MICVGATLGILFETKKFVQIMDISNIKVQSGILTERRYWIQGNDRYLRCYTIKSSSHHFDDKN